MNEQSLRTEPDIYDEKVAFLAQTPIFQRLSDSALLAFARAATPILCQAGHILYYPGQKSHAFFLLRQGEVQIYHLSADGRKLITQTITPGDYFGTLPGLPGSPLTASTSFAEATTTSQIYTFTESNLNTLIELYPEVATRLLYITGQRLLSLEAQLVTTTFHTATARLATLLLQLAQPSSISAEEERIVQGFSHEDLADRLGTYRETVSASLRELKAADAIKIGRKRITIHQPWRLQEIALSNGKTHTVHTYERKEKKQVAHPPVSTEEATGEENQKDNKKERGNHNK